MLFSHQTPNEFVLKEFGLFKKSSRQEHLKVVECQFDYIYSEYCSQKHFVFQAYFLFSIMLLSFP